MKIEIEQAIYVVQERQCLGTMVEYDCEVFDTEQKARAYMEKRANEMFDYIDDSHILRDGDEDMYRGVDIVVEKEDGLADEWWEAELTRKEIK